MISRDMRLDVEQTFCDLGGTFPLKDGEAESSLSGEVGFGVNE